MLICLLACVACSDETLINQKVEEGVPVMATLSFQSSDPGEIETKATDLDEENPVESLAVFIFKKKGETSERVGDVHIYTSTEIDNKKITIKTTSGERYIYAIGNYKSSLFTISDDVLNNIQTIDDLKAMTVTLPREGENISVYDNLFLMSGSVSKDGYNIESSCTINEKGVVDGKLYLKRIMSSIQFVINGPTKKGASFVPTSWQVKKLPQKSNVIELVADCKDTDDSDYANSKIHKSFSGTNKNEFSFLMLENRKDAKDASIISNRDDREKQNGSVENFIAADKNSTYVVLKGTYTGTTNIVNGRSDKKVEAYTTYFIHLGDWSEENKNDYTDFRIFRNNRYIYTVTVNGVDDLIVEVTTDKELWGGEGDMYLSDDEIMTFDAHYGTTIISFKKAAIQNLINNYGGDLDNFKEKFKIKAATPKNNFDLEGTEDIDWVTFKRNTEGPDNFMPYKANEADQPMNADKFKQDLYDVAMDKTNNDDVIYYTCFIDEYFYPNLKLKDFVNQKSRTIQIGTDYKKNETSSSTSSISKAAYTFSQKSIWTVYDLDKLDREESINGWGSESVMEGEPIAKFKNSSYTGKNTNSLLQGYSNMKGLIGGNPLWDDLVNYQKNQVNKSAVEYACLNRNRDLNGNGKIDDDEIRWYLPALNQYIGFWMGVDALPVEVRLYPYADRSDVNYVYLTSTVVNGNGLRVFWANQGSNTGYYGPYGSGDGPRPYRCVRNLRSVTGDVTDFVDRTKGAGYEEGLYQYYTLKYLNPVAIRDNVSQPLRSHTHIEEENRLPYKFELNKGYAGIGTSTVPLKDPCPEGWRLPNQRELTVLTSEWSKNKKMLVSFTTFPWNADKRNFVFNTTNMNIAGDGASDYHYRCIKDVKSDQ